MEGCPFNNYILEYFNEALRFTCRKIMVQSGHILSILAGQYEGDSGYLMFNSLGGDLW